MSTQKIKKHWLLESKSFLDYPQRQYNVGLEPKSTLFLEAEIKRPVFFKYMIPRFFHALIRTVSRQFHDFVNRIRTRILTYDPLITVYPDHVSFLMRDIQNSFWELNLTEHVFRNFNGKRGQVFVDFNADFINQIRTLKTNDVNTLRIDHTGLLYTDSESLDAKFLPSEDRGTLIKLLEQIRHEFSLTPDDLQDIPTKNAWNQSITKDNLTEFSTFRKHDGFESLFDYREIGKGEVYNPFYLLRLGSKTPFDKSRIAKYFSNTMTIGFWEEQNEYLFTIPLIHPENNLYLGGFRFKTTGRLSSKDFDPDPDYEAFQHSRGRRRRR